jgi:type IV fimbrial biogenesis protein FimT
METTSLMYRKDAGFTLAELLMTITIASILLALAIPSFRSLMVDSKLTAQVNDIVGAIRLARSEAIRRNTRVSFCRSGSEMADDCAQDVGRWQHWIVRAAGGSVIRRGITDADASAMAVGSSLVNDEAIFGADGFGQTGDVPLDGQQVTVCTRSGTRANVRRIVLGAASRISIVSAAGAC